jgi:drug/metabolite transporter (DMT)-like permease
MLRAFGLGILASLFFAFTFVLNKQMQVGGGHWIWSAVLRFHFMLPILFALVLPGRKYRKVLAAIRKDTLAWLLWSTVGFGIFYSTICAAAEYGPSWLVASTWQVTIVAGALLSPLFFRKQATGNLPPARHRIPAKQLTVSLIVLAGVLLVQGNQAVSTGGGNALAGFGLVLVAAFAYPLGNRKMMETAGDDIGTLERVFGMSLCSMPFWLILGIAGIASGQLPTAAQLVQSFIVAVFSGVVATLLFFKATELVKDNVRQLAVIESTQAGEVVFTLLGGVLVFNDEAPTLAGFAGIGIIVAGMIINGLLTANAAKD